jgi:hypothetical protein
MKLKIRLILAQIEIGLVELEAIVAANRDPARVDQLALLYSTADRLARRWIARQSWCG